MANNVEQLIDQTKSALALIHTRSVNAATCLEAGLLEEAQHWLKLKKAAFYSFKAKDKELQKYFDLSRDDESQNQYKEILHIEEKLHNLLSDICLKKQEEMREVRRLKENILKFKSQPSASSTRVRQEI